MKITAKERYASLCRNKKLPLFMQNWWLDAVAGANDWDVVVIENTGEVQAALPFVIRRRFGFRFLGMPMLTQCLGPWFDLEELGPEMSLSRQIKLTIALIRRLPKFDRFSLRFSREVYYWAPWYWEGFSQTTRYSFVIDPVDCADTYWNLLDGSVRTDVRKARSRFALVVQSSDDKLLEEFYAVNAKTFGRQSMASPYTLDQLRLLDLACIEKQCRRILLAVDRSGRVHAGVYLVWDDKRIYYLMGGADPELRKSGAQTLLIWEAIRLALAQQLIFDFEGSMIKGVEKTCRAFRARPEPFSQVDKTENRFLGSALALCQAVSIFVRR